MFAILHTGGEHAACGANHREQPECVDLNRLHVFAFRKSSRKALFPSIGLWPQAPAPPAPGSLKLETLFQGLTVCHLLGNAAEGGGGL